MIEHDLTDDGGVGTGSRSPAHSHNNKKNEFAIAILKFDDRNRYGTNGVPALLLFGDNSRTWVVNCKKSSTQHKNSWAKVKIVSSEHYQAELMELLGYVGDYPTELYAYQLYFHILPCRYPIKHPPYHFSSLTQPHEYEDCTNLTVFSVDDISTLDVDDALSLEELSPTHYKLGIHIANVARSIHPNPTTDNASQILFDWSMERGASAYSGGVYRVTADDEHRAATTIYPSNSVPMLPPQLAHDEFSLKENQPRYAITLWLTIEQQEEGSSKKWLITDQSHSQTLIINRQKTTYNHWNSVQQEEDPYLVQCRTIIQSLSGQTLAEDLVAWTMIQYNTYFGTFLASQHKGLLRAQQDPNEAAIYVHANPDPSIVHHASLGIDYYAHCSSPIRRFCDLVNQCIILLAQDRNNNLDVTSRIDLDLYNKRCHELKRYHSTVTTMELAYSCRHEPQTFRGHVEIDDEAPGGQSLLIQIPKKGRVRIPLRDSYFAEPIVERIREATFRNSNNAILEIELFGVLVSGRTRLRGRLLGVVPSSSPSLPQTGISLVSSPSSKSLSSPPQPPPPGFAPNTASSSANAATTTPQSQQGGAPAVAAGAERKRVVVKKKKIKGKVVGKVQHGGGMGGSSIVPIGISPQQSQQVKPPPGFAPSTPSVLSSPPPGLSNTSAGVGPVSTTSSPKVRPPPGFEDHPTAQPTSEQDITFCDLNEKNNINDTIDIDYYFDDDDDGDAAKSSNGTTRIHHHTNKPPQLPAEAQEWINQTLQKKKQLEQQQNVELKESTVNQVLGYHIDSFQQRCLQVIINPQQDLMAMAPTGSGKTAVALMAILQSFARGQRAYYTSPIKALSNQKYSEFIEWFAGRGIDAHVTLLTGDVKIRAPPDATNELIICTSEILRNKLVKASGGDRGSTSYLVQAAREAAAKGDQAAQRALDIMIREGYATPEDLDESLTKQDRGDPDLERLGCVVSDEIHYINDVERGVVWEETLMHLPTQTQLVALSATLRHPEHFVEWIERVRGRQGQLVMRHDRHVPLHVGGIDPASGGKFLEFYGTHDDPSSHRKGGEFDTQIFHQLYGREALEKRHSPLVSDPTRLAQKEAARGARDAELQAQRDAYAGRSGTKGGSSPSMSVGSGTKSNGGGKHHHSPAAGGPSTKKVNFVHECMNLAQSLDQVQKLPAIVFCMSRRMCVQGAHACRSLNLLLGGKPRKPPTEEEGAFAMEEWLKEESIRKERVRRIERQRSIMHQQHLQKFMPELGELEAYRDIMALLARGVAYHHSGMLPILREYVELCFQKRLVRLVFATETLAVGVNMPARTVVFSQVDKPDDQGKGHRWLRVDEFWQMAGRAGRRGLDTIGYVLYEPTLSAAGLKNIAPLSEINRMLTGQVAPATSQLVVDRPFVLRHLLRGHSIDILEKTLKSDEMRRRNLVALEQLTIQSSSPLSKKEEEHQALFDRYDEIDNTLKGTSNSLGIKVKLSQKQTKKLLAEQRAIVSNFPGGEHAFKTAKNKASELQNTLKDIEQQGSELQDRWNRHIEWLMGANFIKDDRKTLTPRGICAAAFSDGEPLIVGTVIADGGLTKLTCMEICAWICLFIPYRATSSGGGDDQPLLPNDDVDKPSVYPSEELMNTVEYSDLLAKQLGREDPLERTLMYLMLDWMTYKDLVRIASTTDPHLLGSFVKCVMRVLSYIDMIKQVLLGLGHYQTHNTLDHHTDALLGGLVTNESLYLHITTTKKSTTAPANTSSQPAVAESTTTTTTTTDNTTATTNIPSS